MTDNTLLETSDHRDQNGTALSSMEKRIEEIIQKRQSIAHKVRPVQTHLSKLQDELTKLKNHYHSLPNSSEQVTAGKESVVDSFKRVEGAIAHNHTTLNQLIQRLSRPTLNIGVIGLMGQGKSTFLKSLSGLSDDEIPALPGGACTAVRSKIYHHNGETKAIVTFHSEQSFLEEVIVPYYEKLDLGVPPQTLQSFAETKLPASPKGATLETMHEHLKNDHHRNFEKYRHHLQSGEPRRVEISKAQIPAYVTQQRDTNNQLLSFDYLAVKEVEIYCQFKHVEVSKLGLVDVPGLGDTRLGDEELILKTLGQEVDSAVFLRRPDPLRFQWGKADTRLYDLAAEALPHLSERAFMVLNHQTSGKNWDACEALSKNPGRIRVVNSLIADCSDEAEANQILKIVLEYLDGHILGLEERYARGCQDNLIQLYRLIDDTLKQAERVLKAETSELGKFDKLFDELRESLTLGLYELLEDLEAKRNEDDADFEAVVQKALSACEQYKVPTEKEILLRKRDCSGKGVSNIVYSAYVVELRVQLSKNFLSLDEGLQQAANQLKEQVAKVLKERGNLASLSTGEGGEYLADLAELLADQNNNLAFGVQMLADFNISYGALILSTIRENLMKLLDPDAIVQKSESVESIARTTAAISVEAIANSGSPVTAELLDEVVRESGKIIDGSIETLFRLDPKSIQNKLKTLHGQAVQTCRTLLEGWLKAPNRIRYYMAKEFVDLILYDAGMKDNWRAFLREPDVRSQIWTHFKEIETLKQSQDVWIASVQKVQQANQRQLMEFL
jgi:energy-coupling factor transporter ATP-binding protein EcfA2